MPIKDKTIYPTYWKQFSEYIRFERADNKCEKCGVPNYSFVERGTRNGIAFYWMCDDGQTFNADTGEYLGQFHSYDLEFSTEAPSRIVLTVAHLDAEGDVCNCRLRTGFLCANPNHVKAMCQRCHNAYDSPKRRANSKNTLQVKNDQNRGLLALTENL